MSFDMTQAKKNALVDNIGRDNIANDSEDVSMDWTQELIRSSSRSKLAWADSLRNVLILNDIAAINPNTVVELGCGNHHPIGKMIAGHGLEPNYIGIDARLSAAENVTKTNGKNSFTGIAHDLSKGIPLKDECADYFLCLEAMEHFCTNIDEVDEFFKEVRRVAKKDAIFWLATPNPVDGELVHPHCHENEFSAEDIICEIGYNFKDILLGRNYRIDSEEYEQPSSFELARLFNTMPQAFVRAVELLTMPFDQNKRGNILLKIRVK